VILQLEGASINTLSRGPTSNLLQGALETFLDSNETAKFDLCVFDGVREQERDCANVVALLNSFTGEATERKIAKVVHVTSLSDERWRREPWL
jgi:predicted type IV restriction endonuclease